MDIHSDPLLGPLEHTPEGVRAGDCVIVEKLGRGEESGLSSEGS